VGLSLESYSRKIGVDVYRNLTELPLKRKERTISKRLGDPLGSAFDGKSGKRSRRDSSASRRPFRELGVLPRKKDRETAFEKHRGDIFSERGGKELDYRH